MDDQERMKLVAVMGLEIAKLDAAIRANDRLTATAAFVSFMGGAGMLAIEIDELDSTDAN